MHIAHTAWPAPPDLVFQASLKVDDRDDAKGAHVTVVLFQRNVLSGSEAMLVEPVTGLVVVFCFWIVVYRPGAAALMN